MVVGATSFDKLRTGSPLRNPHNECPMVRQLETVYRLPQVRVTHTILDPGEEVPWHHHTQVADTFYVVAGPVRIMTRAPSGSAILAAGEIFRTAVGQPHRVVNESDHAVEFLLIQGVGEHDFHREPAPTEERLTGEAES